MANSSYHPLEQAQGTVPQCPERVKTQQKTAKQGQRDELQKGDTRSNATQSFKANLSVFLEPKQVA